MINIYLAHYFIKTETLINRLAGHCEARPFGPKQSRFIEDQYVVRSRRRCTPRDDGLQGINQRFQAIRDAEFTIEVAKRIIPLPHPRE